MQRGNGQPYPAANNYNYGNAWGGSAAEDEDEEALEENSALQAELESVKATLKALTSQFYEERKQWYDEKKELQKIAVTPSSNMSSPASSGRTYNANIGGMTRGLERVRPVSKADPNSPDSTDASSALQQQLDQLQAILDKTISERDAAQRETAQLKAETSRWNVERASLQRQVEVLSAKAGGGEEFDEQIAVLEDENAVLKAELNALKESLKDNVLVPKSQMSNLTASSSFQRQDSASKPVGPPSTARSMSNSSLAGASSGPAAAPDPAAAATIAKLNAQITRLQADLYIIKDECVPVPKAEFASLKAVHTAKAEAEQDIKKLRQELDDSNKLVKMLQEELEMIKEDLPPVTQEEYQELKRIAQEKAALEVKLEAQAKYYAQVPKEDLQQLQESKRQLAQVETKLAALMAVQDVKGDDRDKALQAATDAAADLRGKLMESEAIRGDLQKELSSSEGRQQRIAELTDRVKALEAAAQTAANEKSRLQQRVKSLEADLEEAKAALKADQDDSSKLSLEVGALKDQVSSLSQEVSTLSRERGELDAALQEAKRESEVRIQELIEAKFELARLSESEVRLKKTIAELSKP